MLALIDYLYVTINRVVHMLLLIMLLLMDHPCVINRSCILLLIDHLLCYY